MADNRDKYTELLLRHRQRVWSMCWRYADGSWEHCRDLVQEVSVELWQHYGSLRPGAHRLQEIAWVRLHTRRVLNHLHRGLRNSYVPLTTDAAECIVDEPDASRECVDDLIASLGDTDREIVRLRLEGYDAAEIAERVGLGRNAVYQRLHRVVKFLRGKYGYEG